MPSGRKINAFRQEDQCCQAGRSMPSGRKINVVRQEDQCCQAGRSMLSGRKVNVVRRGRSMLTGRRAGQCYQIEKVNVVRQLGQFVR